VIPSQTGFLGLVREISERVALLYDFDGPSAQRVALAVDEATTNAIKHAYGGAGDREVEVRFSETALELRIEVIDEGRAVDRRTIPRVDLDRFASEGRTGGLGVHLMGRIMDSVSFRRESGRNVCCLRKRKPGPDGLPR
jgi:serine/threonine-protein kinase RsbW